MRSRKPILDPAVEKYVNTLLPERDEVLSEMETYAATHKIPIIGPACGRLLYQLARIQGARRVFEMGSAIGYSTLWLARAVGEAGVVIYTDDNPENARRAEEYFKKAGAEQRIQIRVGDALTSLAAEEGTFDLIFNDVDKEQYPDVLPKAVARLRPGGLFITDNVLWHGRAARKVKKGDRETPAIQQFNKLIYKSKELFTTIIPLRDGLAVCRKVEY